MFILGYSVSFFKLTLPYIFKILGYRTFTSAVIERSVKFTSIWRRDADTQSGQKGTCSLPHRRTSSRQPYGLLGSHVHARLIKLLTDAGALLLAVPAVSTLPLLHGSLLGIEM